MRWLMKKVFVFPPFPEKKEKFDFAVTNTVNGFPWNEHFSLLLFLAVGYFAVSVTIGWSEKVGVTEGKKPNASASQDGVESRLEWLHNENQDDWDSKPFQRHLLASSRTFSEFFFILLFFNPFPDFFKIISAKTRFFLANKSRWKKISPSNFYFSSNPPSKGENLRLRDGKSSPTQLHKWIFSVVKRILLSLSVQPLSLHRWRRRTEIYYGNTFSTEERRCFSLSWLGCCQELSEFSFYSLREIFSVSKLKRNPFSRGWRKNVLAIFLPFPFCVNRCQQGFQNIAISSFL